MPRWQVLSRLRCALPKKSGTQSSGHSTGSSVGDDGADTPELTDFLVVYNAIADKHQ